MHPESPVSNKYPLTDRRSWEQYLSTGDRNSEFGIKAVRWQEYEFSAGGNLVTERSMLLEWELALLFMLAKDAYTGAGEIVDLGPLLGIGTNAFARGLAQNPQVSNKLRRIHSYDLFLSRGMGSVITETAKSGSIFDRFLRNNRDFLPSLSLSPGNLLDLSWDRSPIEILFVDLAKSWDLNQFVLEHFFPYLIPGRSIVVQQDYVHSAEYWVPITMEVLADYFEPLYYIQGSTVVYRCIREIPNELLFERCRSLTLEEKIMYLERAQAKAPPSAREILKCSQAYCLADNNRGQEAITLLQTVKRQAPASSPTEDFNDMIDSNVSIAKAAIRQCLGNDAIKDEKDEAAAAANRGFQAALTVRLDRDSVASKSPITGDVSVTNIGTLDWRFPPDEGLNVNLGAHLFDAAGTTCLEFDFLRRHIGTGELKKLSPGESVSFRIEFQPPEYGKFVIEFDVVAELICWFQTNGSKTVRIPISVH